MGFFGIGGVFVILIWKEYREWIISQKESFYSLFFVEIEIVVYDITVSIIHSVIRSDVKNNIKII